MRPAPGVVRRAVTAGLLSLVAATAAACANQPAPATAPSPSASIAAPASVAPSAVPSASAPLPSTGVEHDASLLALLPASLDAVGVEEEPEAFAEAVSDPDFVASVAAAAFPIVAAGPDLASGVVARLRPGVFSDAFFRDWRDTYNEGACAQAGGIVGNAEAQLGGRTTYITSCAGGLLVYHAWIEQRGVVVSLFSVGDGRFGERMMDGLRP